MSRGFFTGIFWGLVITFLLIAVVSLNGRLPGNIPPEAGSAEVPAGSQFNGAREDAPAVLPGRSEATKVPEAASLAAPDADGLDTIDSAATTPAARPETGGPESTLVATPPEAAASDAPAAGGADSAPVTTGPADPVPAAPGTEALPDPATRPAAPPAPEVAAVAAPEAPEDESGAAGGFPSQDLMAAAEAPRPRPPGPDAAVQVPAAAERGGLPATDTGTVRPEAPEAPAAPRAEADEAMPETPAPETAAPDAAAADRAEAPAEEADPPAAPGNPVAPEAGTETAATAAPEEEEASALPGRQAGTLTERDGGRDGERRLPGIGSQTGSAATAATETEAPSPAEDADLPPIRRYAAPFENPEGRPLMSIVLMDAGAGSVPRESLTEFPFPVTIALDPARPGAAEAMRTYRDAGLEVMLLAGLGAGAEARDLETAYESWRTTLPEAVAVMETPGLGLQESKAVAEHLGPMLSATGQGLVLFPNGFDTARKLAAKAGVPAATVFRDFDAEGQDEAVIRRFLDHAAFRARQSDGVIMVGRLRPETVQALASWGLQDRAGQVALAPVSALLLAGQAGG
ncbi:divergent polysaccharide deacetylase family protein [Pseudooceanicola nanhaiensis]|uniref:divergent polysaccharide deacetylase family protein n=1 Tax=Pseudooceanicola nanhaiensis TaxID=375761 RepID=UPI00405891A8